MTAAAVAKKPTKPKARTDKPYAYGTRLSRLETIGQIEALLEDKGADRVEHGKSDDIAMEWIAFELRDTRFRHIIPMPRRDDPAVLNKKVNQSGYTTSRTREEAKQEYEKRVAARWRAAFNTINAAIIADKEGIVTLEEALAADIVGDNGYTVREVVRLQILARAAGDTSPIKVPMLALPAPKSEGR